MPPAIIEPLFNGQITGTFDINLQTDPGQYFDADSDAWQATDWIIRDVGSGQAVWQTGFVSSPPLVLYRVDFSDGTFVGPLAGQTQLNYSTNYQLEVRYRDANSETSNLAIRTFTTAAATSPVPGAGTWLVRPGYVVEPVQTGLRLPVNIAFVPNPGSNPDDPLYYVNELYGSIKVVKNNGTMSTFASGLLDYNPEGPISGTGEQGLTGIAVERDTVNSAIYHLYVGMLWDNGAPAGAPNHYPKVERIDSAAGGLTMASRTVLLNMQPETQGQSHIISNFSIGPDGKLYVHMGDGFTASTALNLDSYRGKVLRMNKEGTAPTDNPLYDAGNGINARDYIFTYGHRNPFGGAWRPGTTDHWVVENGNTLDRMMNLVAGQSYGWAGNDTALSTFSKYNWNSSSAPVNIDFIDSTKFGGSGYPSETYGNAFVSLSGSTYAAGVQQRAKSIEQFTDLDTLNGSGKLAVAPQTLVKYNGTGRASVAALATGPDGIYFSDLYEDAGSGGATGSGANIYRVRYVGSSGGAIPTVATAASATPNPVSSGTTANLSVLGADDGGEANLTYSWGVQGSPPAGVSFSVNGTNAAKNTVATFGANGVYDLFVIIRDGGGQAVISNVTVNVTSIPTGTGDGLAVTYYNNINLTGTTVSRIDPTVNFDWGTGSPDAAIAVDTFSARWTGYVQPRFSGTYTFLTTTDDGVRLYVNGQLLIDHWVNQSSVEWSGTINLTANQLYSIQMDFFENGGFAVAKLEWQSAQQTRQVIPQTQLYSGTSPPIAPNGLTLTPLTQSLIRLNWTDNSFNETGFEVQRSADGVNFTLVAIVAADTTSYQDAGLTPGTHYYRVRAVNASGNSAYTNGVGTPTTNLAPAVNYSAGFAGGAGLSLNNGAIISGTALRVTNGATQNRSGFTTARYDIRRFTTTFDFLVSATSNQADGFTFTVQGAGATAVGSTGGGLGYGTDGVTAGNRIGQSLAIKFDLYSNAGEGINSTGVYTNGADPINPSVPLTGVNLHGGRQIRTTVTYDGSNLFFTMLDLVNQQTFQRTFSGYDIPSLVGGTTGYVGFTGGTGSLVATQDILTLTHTPLPPVVVQSATVNQGNVQRSRVTRVDLQFSGAVNLGAAAFTLTDPLGTPIPNVTVAAATTVTGPGTLASLTFGGMGTQFGSLADGRYRLVVHGTNITDALNGALDGDANGSLGGDYVLQFHRLFGDSDGDATVTQSDFIAFRNAFNAGPSEIFDFDGTGQVGQDDFIQFRNRFNTSV